MGAGRIPWLAGVHDQGEDAGNPHAHFIFRDRDRETGKRVAGLSEKGSTERLREIWERVANHALERGGYDARIDRRSLEAQGIAREAGIHVGPNVLAMEERGVRPSSRPEITLDGRVINWPKIDQGRTRLDRQAEIEAANENREKERDGDKGKGRGDPSPAAPAGDAERDTSAVSLSPEEQRRALADQLQGFVADPAQEPQRGPVDAVREGAAPDAPAKEGEATQRASSEAVAAGLAPPQAEAADRAPDVSRFRQAIDRARGRLDALSIRLDQAFSRIKERLLDREPPPERSRSPLAQFRRDKEPPPSLGDVLGQFRRHRGTPSRDGPER